MIEQPDALAVFIRDTCIMPFCFSVIVLSYIMQCMRKVPSLCHHESEGASNQNVSSFRAEGIAATVGREMLMLRGRGASLRLQRS